MVVNTQGLLHLLLTFAMVALLPLSWVWVSREPDKFRKLTWVALFLTFDLIVFGAFTRLTDSGLGCPDWPGCYGHANPLQAQAHIDAAAALMPDGPVTRSKAWIEMVHRYLAGAIGVLCIVLLASSWRIWRKAHSAAHDPRLPGWLLLCVCVQGGFGAATVTLKLQPVIVTIHLLLGMLFLVLMTRLAVRQVPLLPEASDASLLPIVNCGGGHGSGANGSGEGAGVGAGCEVAPQLRLWLWADILLLFVQIALGGWVSTNYATLACTEFPMCQGRWVPEMDFTHGFSLWRELGKTVGGEYLPFPALTAIHWVHRNFAWLVCLMLLLLCWKVRVVTAPAAGTPAAGTPAAGTPAAGSPAAGTPAAHFAWVARGLRSLANKILGVLLLQLLTGLATIYFSFPLAIAVLHNAGAALLVLLLTMLHYRAMTKLPAV